MPLTIFPVSGGAKYSNDYGEPRSSGRTHQGNDLFGPEQRPLLAVDDGEVRYGTDPLGGNVANLRSPDGTRYYYAHLFAFEGANRKVKAGDVIGYMGRTGNAITTPVHLHFEVHPGGGDATNPYPLLLKAQVLTVPEKSIVPTPPVASGSNALWYVGGAAVLGLGTWYWFRRRR
jgi:murein DD-endopeptidase MepM/ murein hydrolase activator NlpD